MAKKRVLLIIETSRHYGRGLITGISRFALEQGNWQIHFDDRGLLEEPSDWLRNWKGHGVLARTATSSLAAILARKRCPVVELHGFGMYEDGISQFAEVQVCDRSIGAMAAAHFLERGLRHTGFYSCGSPWWSRTRSEPFIETLKRRSISCYVYSDGDEKSVTPHPVWENRYEKSLKKWLKSLPKPIGIWGITDVQAVRVLEACHDLGYHIPEEVAVLGTSNDEMICNLVSPPLSSIDVNCVRIGYDAAKRLEQKMSGIMPEKPYINIPPLNVVSRRSTDIIAIQESDIAAALHLIRNRACEGITVAKVVREIGISRRSLERNFCKYFGRSPHDEIIRIRIERAKTLLCSTDISITSIAEESGFNSREYFIFAFHRETGTTPHLYRQTNSF